MGEPEQNGYATKAEWINQNYVICDILSIIQCFSKLLDTNLLVTLIAEYYSTGSIYDSLDLLISIDVDRQDLQPNRNMSNYQCVKAILQYFEILQASGILPKFVTNDLQNLPPLYSDGGTNCNSLGSRKECSNSKKELQPTKNENMSIGKIPQSTDRDATLPNDVNGPPTTRKEESANELYMKGNPESVREGSSPSHNFVVHEVRKEERSTIRMEPKSRLKKSSATDIKIDTRSVHCQGAMYRNNNFQRKPFIIPGNLSSASSTLLVKGCGGNTKHSTKLFIKYLSPECTPGTLAQYLKKMDIRFLNILDKTPKSLNFSMQFYRCFELQIYSTDLDRLIDPRMWAHGVEVHRFSPHRHLLFKTSRLNYAEENRKRSK